jgi:hypothetical protein
MQEATWLEMHDKHGSTKRGPNMPGESWEGQNIKGLLLPGSAGNRKGGSWCDEEGVDTPTRRIAKRALEEEGGH